MGSNRGERLLPGLAVWAGLVCVVAAAAGPGGGIALQDTPLQDVTGGRPVMSCGGNSMQDRDRNGKPDFACVADWDLDGVYELLDIQAAVGALTDDGDKLIVLAGKRFVAPPESPEPDAIIKLTSRTTIEGTSGTVLVGFEDSDLVSRAAVIGAFDSQHDVTIRRLEIDGNWHTGDADAVPGIHRMGILLRQCTNCTVEQVDVHDTQHACIYAKNGLGLTVQDNTLTRCGNIDGDGPRYTCMYFFADSGLIHEQILARGNRCVDSSGGVSLRRSDAASIVRDVQLQDNVFADMHRFDGAPGPCIVLRGAEYVEVRGGSCSNTGSIQTVDVGMYYDDGEVNAVKNVLIEDVLIGSVGPLRSGLQIRDYTTNVTVRDVSVVGTQPESACLAFTQPQRGSLYEGLLLRDCGTRGIFESVAVPLSGAADETLVFRDVRVEHVASLDGMWLRSDSSIVMEDVDVVDADRYGLYVTGALSDSELTNLSVRETGSDAIHIAGAISNVSFDDLTVENAGGSGVELRSTDSVVATFTGTTISGTGDRGFFMPGSPTGSVTIDGLVTSSTATDAVEIWSSGTVGVSNGEFRWYGGSAPGSHAARGLEIHVAAPAALANNILEDAGTAEYGVYVDGNADPASLCTTTCVGLEVDRCIHVADEPGYGVDSDGDGTPDACQFREPGRIRAARSAHAGP